MTKKNTPKTTMSFPLLLQRFFAERLVDQLRASPNTIAGYRDTFRLLLGFASQQRARPPTRLTFDDINAELVGEFLLHIESTRGNGARSRNTRLAAIRSFFRFVAMHEPSRLFDCHRILAMPAKRFVRQPIDFLDDRETVALLAAPDRSTWIGRRDHALLLLALQTGLRASELSNLCCGDAVTGAGSHVSCQGKGRKHRCTPLRNDTVTVLDAWKQERGGDPRDPLFPSLRGTAMSRDALEHLVHRHAMTASRSCPSLKDKRVSPHVLRHTTAMQLLHGGVDQAVIALWLGHESVETTQVYVHADLKLKEQALARVVPSKVKPGRYRPDDELLAFLQSL